MRQKERPEPGGQSRRTDIALLWLRMFIGAIVLLHNIGQLQTYNEIIGSYPPLIFGDSAVAFGVISISESVLAVMIMSGFMLRLAASVMALGMLLSIFVVIPMSGIHAATLQFVYMGIYVFLAIAGGGRYAPDHMLWGNKVS